MSDLNSMSSSLVLIHFIPPTQQSKQTDQYNSLNITFACSYKVMHQASIEVV